MASISIKLSSLDDFKTIKVEGLGVIKVKKESSNQGLRLSENTRDVFKLQDEARSLQKKINLITKKGLKNDDPEVKKLEIKATDKLDKITEIRKSIQSLRKARLSDDQDGKLVERLFNEADDEDIFRLFELADGLKDEEDE